jgi:hypothetical protein
MEQSEYKMTEPEESLGLRMIDEELLRAGRERRVKCLSDYLDERLKKFDADVASDNLLRNLPKQQQARRFGELLASEIKNYLAFERQHKINTNWNTPQEEEEHCRRTAELAESYYLSTSKPARKRLIADCLNSFSHLPMVLEEMADEEFSIKNEEEWKDTPFEARRGWIKACKGSRRMSLEGAALDFEPDPTFYLRYYERYVKLNNDTRKRAGKK